MHILCASCFLQCESTVFSFAELVFFHFRDLPLCLGISMTIVTGCYVLINVAYIAVLGKDNILNNSAVALVCIHSLWFYSRVVMIVLNMVGRNFYHGALLRTEFQPIGLIDWFLQYRKGFWENSSMPSLAQLSIVSVIYKYSI